MRLTIVIDENWSAGQLANHLRNLARLYRFEVFRVLYYAGQFSLSGTDWSEYLAGFDLKRKYPEMDRFDLQVSSINYASPTIEVFEGIANGITGVADLVERLIFFKQTRRLKDLSVADAELATETRKLRLLENAIEVLAKSGASEQEMITVRDLYLRAVLDTAQIVERGNLIELSRATLVDDQERRIITHEEFRELNYQANRNRLRRGEVVEESEASNEDSDIAPPF